MDLLTFFAENPGFGLLWLFVFVIFGLLSFTLLDRIIGVLHRWTDPSIRKERIRAKMINDKNRLDAEQVDALCRLSKARATEAEANSKQYAEMSRLLELTKKYKLKLHQIDDKWPVVDEDGTPGHVDDTQG